MAFKEYNNNPYGKKTGDDIVRAISTAINENWDTVYYELLLEGYALKDLPTADYVWGSYLYRNGFTRHVMGDKCPKHYTVRNFADDHETGVYVLYTGRGAVTVINGYYYDYYDSGDKVVSYYWEKGVA